MSQIPETANKGLENIIACTSEISAIHDVTLLYRGYKIEDLVQHCTFEEVAYLLWNAKLPSKSELSQFKKDLAAAYGLTSGIIPAFDLIAKTKAHSMAKLRTAVSYFGLGESDAENITPAGVKKNALRLTGAMSAIVASVSRLEQGKTLVDPKSDRSIAWNFLNMIRGKEPTTEEEKLFDVALILHADHELNASTFTARVVASTTSDYYSDITAAICSLKGPLHGGANEAVMQMLEEIGSYKNVEPFVRKAIQTKAKVMGIGHRVYKNGDPRARLLKEMSLQICQKAGLEEKHKMLVKIQEIMESEKGLMPNVDFYSGLVYTALGLRPRDFTPIFAVSRVTGWSAQIMEQYANNRIYRPRAHYTGPVDIKVIPLNDRKGS